MMIGKNSIITWRIGLWYSERLLMPLNVLAHAKLLAVIHGVCVCEGARVYEAVWMCIFEHKDNRCWLHSVRLLDGGWWSRFVCWVVWKSIRPLNFLHHLFSYACRSIDDSFHFVMAHVNSIFLIRWCLHRHTSAICHPPELNASLRWWLCFHDNAMWCPRKSQNRPTFEILTFNVDQNFEKTHTQYAFIIHT